MKRFQDLCGGPFEASAVMSHLSAQGKARYLSLPNKGDLVEVPYFLCFCGVNETLHGFHFCFVTIVHSHTVDLLC